MMNLMNRASSNVSFLPLCGEIVRVVAGAALDRHPPVVGQDVEGVLEEVVVALETEVLERLDGHDPVDGVAELLPAAQQHLVRAIGVHAVQQLLAVGVLVLRQRQTDDVDVVLLQRALHRGAPAAADVEQRHARLEIELVEVEVDLGDLRFLQRHVVAVEVRAAVRARRVLEQPEEVVGQVVMRLDFLEMGLQPVLRLHYGHLRQSPPG